MSIEAGIPGRGAVDVRDFPGLMDNIDQRDIPPGATDDQINICCIVLGELSCRLGYKVVSFDSPA